LHVYLAFLHPMFTLKLTSVVIAGIFGSLQVNAGRRQGAPRAGVIGLPYLEVDKAMMVKKMNRHDSEDTSNADNQAAPENIPEESPEASAQLSGEEDGVNMADMMAMYEESFKPVETGQIVEGEIVGLERDKVVLDIGYKYEGEVSSSEFADPDGKVDLHVGDRVEVYFVGKDEDGYPILSREEVRTEKLLEELGRTYESGEPVQGRIVARVKGGFFVDIGIRAFLPASQLDIKPAKDPDEWIGTDHEFKILQFDKAERNVVISRRVLVEAQRQKEQEQALHRLNSGEVVEGTITNITDYGLFVDLGGITGLVHVSNLSWTPVRQHPSKMYEVGETVSVKVLDIDTEGRKVSLGIKQLTPYPCDTLEEQYPKGTVIEGKIKKVTDFGIFVGILEGINGMVHASDISWIQPVKPAEHFRKGQTVQAKILDIDRQNQRVNLGIKHLSPNPWEELPQKYAPGTRVRGKVVNVAEFGLFVEIEEGIQGLVHLSELPHGQGESPLEDFEVGQEVEARVIEVLPEEHKVRLTLRDEKPDRGKGAKKSDQAGAELGETDLGRLLKEKFEDQF
jgi:small subunit ribosomal protein S1